MPANSFSIKGSHKALKEDTELTMKKRNKLRDLCVKLGGLCV